MLLSNNSALFRFFSFMFNRVRVFIFGVFDWVLCFGNRKVHNVKEDCYGVWERNEVPNYDVLITNPPYSGNHVYILIIFIYIYIYIFLGSFANPFNFHLPMNHGQIERLLKFCSEQGRPFFLLLPNWVHRKPYFEELLLERRIRPFFLVPDDRYVYLPPKVCRYYYSCIIIPSFIRLRGDFFFYQS